jgi:DNA-binding GntR family transcriptional regulator
MGSGELREQAYHHLHQKILSGELMPGSRISEQSISKELGTSRMPVRDAIRQLQNEGLVEQVPRFGTVIFKPKRKDVVDLYQLREALESHAAAHVAKNTPHSLLEKLMTYVEAMKTLLNELQQSNQTQLQRHHLMRYLAIDMAFHMMIIQATGNARLIKALKDTQSLAQVFRARRQSHDREMIEDAVIHHQAIYEALKDNDAEAARAAMAKHLQNSMRTILEYFDRQNDVNQQELTPDLPPDILRELNFLEQKE